MQANNEFRVETYGTGFAVFENVDGKDHLYAICATETEAQERAKDCNNVRTKLANQFERYEILSDNRCQVSCEFGSWIYGGTYRSGLENEHRARGAVSTMRYNAYWSTISPCDSRRGA